MLCSLLLSLLLLSFITPQGQHKNIKHIHRQNIQNIAYKKHKKHKITSQEQRINSRIGLPHILSRQYHRMSTDHILNVEHCTHFFSDMPRSLAHYFQADYFFANMTNKVLRQIAWQFTEGKSYRVTAKLNRAIRRRFRRTQIIWIIRACTEHQFP